MIVCNNCGNPIAPGERSCTECGNENAASGWAPQISATSVHADQGRPASTAALDRSFNTALVVAGAVFLVAIGGLSAWFLLSTEPRNQLERSVAAASPPETTSRLPAPRGAPLPAPSPPVRVPVPDNTQAVSEVTDALNGWAAASEAHDLEGHMSYYAETLDTYFSKRNVSVDYVRGSKRPAFTRYHTLGVQLSNIQVSVDSSGTYATAIFDKTYRFEGDKVLSGSVQQSVSLSKASGRWRITVEKDLRVYYTNK